LQLRGINVLVSVYRIMTIDYIKETAMSYFSDAPRSHDWDHTVRVFNLCMHIGTVEGADMQVLRVAAYLHDIGRPFQDRSNGNICHAQKGAEMAEEILKDEPISADRKANIIHCIRSHRFRGNTQPQTLEAKVLFDADKLDSIGAVGIARAFQFAGEVGARLHNPSVDPEKTDPYTIEDTAYREFRLKLSKIKDRMLTKEGRRIAEERHEFMKMFFDRFLQEYGHES
jgi:uncharacterized protein